MFLKDGCGHQGWLDDEMCAQFVLIIPSLLRRINWMDGWIRKIYKKVEGKSYKIGGQNEVTWSWNLQKSFHSKSCSLQAFADAQSLHTFRCFIFLDLSDVWCLVLRRKCFALEKTKKLIHTRRKKWYKHSSELPKLSISFVS